MDHNSPHPRSIFEIELNIGLEDMETVVVIKINDRLDLRGHLEAVVASGATIRINMQHAHGYVVN